MVVFLCLVFVVDGRIVTGVTCSFGNSGATHSGAIKADVLMDSAERVIPGVKCKR